MPDMSLLLRINSANRLFIFLTLLLLLSDTLFIWINLRADQAQLQKTLHEEAEHLHLLFDVQLRSTATRMQQTAAYIAMDRQVQQLFHEGRMAAEAEGGGGGGIRAAAVRNTLLQRLQAPWQHMQQEYDTRQLHFEYGEQATSFLRLHAPEKYGDPLETIRFTISDAIRMRQPTMGFESGRIVSGIRGVVPVFASIPDKAQPEFVGVLEAGTSFHVMLQQMVAVSGAQFAVLLRRDHLRGNLLPERMAAAEASGKFVGEWYIEASSTENVQPLLASEVVQRSLAGHELVLLHEEAGKSYAVHSFPLRDYLGEIDANRPAVGTVVAWRPITEQLAQKRHNFLINLAYALAALLVIELMLWFGIRMTTRHLNGVIARQTEELREQAIHDQLTGLYNRYYLDDAFERECARAKRHHVPLSLAMLDLDHFKQINDLHGHLTGDRVLADFAHLISQRLRGSDIIVRYGGEEIVVLLGNTSAGYARETCEMLRERVMSSSLGGLLAGSVTVSIGLSTMEPDESCELKPLLHRADTALYRAKELGRNRVEERHG